MDNRKNNGGHSTKSKGADKRKNEYRNALELAASVENVVEVLKTVYDKAVNKQDMSSSKTIFRILLSKPKESVDIHTSGDSVVSFNEILRAIKSDNDQ
jgi:hypothetical protein